MTWLHRRRETCRLCDSRQVRVAVPLAPVPIVTPNIGSDDRAVQMTLAPLDLFLCEACGHLQLLDVVNPAVQYTNYLYRTAISMGLADHFGRLCEDTCAALAPVPGDLVVEIGSNDGTLLRFFAKKGLTVLGIDPAREIARQATEAGIETLAEFFNEELAARLAAQRGQAKLIIANNVVANIDDLVHFVLGVKRLMRPDGAFVFETQDGAAVIERNLIDTIYHEHLSYFLVRPLVGFFARLGLQLVDAQKIVTKGGSLRLTVQHAGGPLVPSERLKAAIDQETDAGLGASAPYDAFTHRNAAIKRQLLDSIDAERAQGREVAGYGTSVGTVTLLHQFDLFSRLAFLVDDNPFKAALSGPGYDIPVLSPTSLYERRPSLVIVLAWRYADAIIGKHQAYKDAGGRFLVPLPDISVH